MSRERITIADVQATLDLANRFTGVEYYAYYESGRAHVSYKTGPGRSTVFSGTARECHTFAHGIREGAMAVKVGA